MHSEEALREDGIRSGPIRRQLLYGQAPEQRTSQTGVALCGFTALIGEMRNHAPLRILSSKPDEPALIPQKSPLISL